MIVTTTDNRK